MGIAEIFGFRPAGEARAAEALYSAIVAQARAPRLFSSLHVPDTLDGRFETVALHVFLIVQRLKSEPSDGAVGLSRALLETFVADMDRSLRELGVGDLGVGRRVKAMTEALYGRIRAYELALQESDDAALEAALRRNLYGTLEMPQPNDLAAAARYARCQHEMLAAQPFAELLAGQARFVPLSDAIGPEMSP